MISVAIVEDDLDFLKNLVSLVNSKPDLVCSLSVNSIESLLPKLDPKMLPDVILMDLNLPGISGIDGIRLIKDQYPSIDIMVLTIYLDAKNVFSALRAGASGYLLKNTSRDEIIEGIKLVYADGALMSPKIARKVIDHFHPKKKTPQEKPLLTQREMEIVVGIVDGLTYKSIASRLNISLDTVRHHIKNVYYKLQVNSKTGVVKKWFKGEI